MKTSPHWNLSTTKAIKAIIQTYHWPHFVDFNNYLPIFSVQGCFASIWYSAFWARLFLPDEHSDFHAFRHPWTFLHIEKSQWIYVAWNYLYYQLLGWVGHDWDNYSAVHIRTIEIILGPESLGKRPASVSHESPASKLR